MLRSAIALALALALAVAVAVAVAVALALALAVAVALALALALALAVRSLRLAKAMEDPEGGLHGCRPFFIGTWMSRMKNPCVGIARAGL
ncbi:hypothetical protein [Lysobacter sp. ESA13C]|uniref:hypothetical protein n=1 Tax=Lysobacter sp. ESA13C TaxID=2862676 RepID=UPI001CBE905C|nr:hypothetical protein [Lysobacter sp. ESA13C]